MGQKFAKFSISRITEMLRDCYIQLETLKLITERLYGTNHL